MKLRKILLSYCKYSYRSMKYREVGLNVMLSLGMTFSLIIVPYSTNYFDTEGIMARR